MRDEDFKFLVLKNHENGLVFVALDSVVGYIRHLSEELANVSFMSEDPAASHVISRAFALLSERLEDMEQEDGGTKISEI
jgi:hypothetical protein